MNNLKIGDKVVLKQIKSINKKFIIPRCLKIDKLYTIEEIQYYYADKNKVFRVKLYDIPIWYFIELFEKGIKKQRLLKLLKIYKS